jgi:hypothetical protein
MRAIHRPEPAPHKFFSRSQGRSGCPSIGSAGLMVDRISNRVKGIIPKLVARTNELIDILDTAGSLASREGATRSSVRVFLPSFHSLGKTREGRALASFIRQFGASGHEGGVERFEGIIPFNSQGNSMMVAYFGINSPSRVSPQPIIDIETNAAARASFGLSACPLSEGYSIRPAGVQDVSQLVELYSNIFSSYLVDLNENTIFSMVESTPTLVSVHSGRVVAALAAEHACFEVDGIGSISMVEISEAATDAAHRGNHLYSHMIGVFLSTIDREIGDNNSIIYAETRAAHPAAARGALLAGGTVSGFLNKHCLISAVRDVQETGEYENLNVVHFQGA